MFLLAFVVSPFACAGQHLTKKGGLTALFFVTHDCPISNHYAREIRRICEAYGPRGLSCALVYVDPSLTDAAALAHAREYGHGAYPIVVDRRHDLVRMTGVTITPEVAVLTEVRHDRSLTVAAQHEAVDSQTVTEPRPSGSGPGDEVRLSDRRVAYRGRIDDFFAGWGRSRRQAREHSLRDALDALLAGMPVPTPETKAVGCFIGDLVRAAGSQSAGNWSRTSNPLSR